jgi:hypothetical protein
MLRLPTRPALTVTWIAAVLGPVVVGAGATACHRPKAEINGLGPWILGKTTLQDAGGFCNPGQVTFCSHAGTFPLGQQQGDVNLYFRGQEPSAPLIEIELTVRRCDAPSVVESLTGVLGAPTETNGEHRFWSGKAAFVSVHAPTATRGCEVSFVTVDDADRIAELKQP